MNGQIELFPLSVGKENLSRILRLSVDHYVTQSLRDCW